MLIKVLHEGHIGPNVPMIFAMLQHILEFHVKLTTKSGALDAYCFEEVLKSVPTQRIQILVDELQSLVDQAKSLPDVLLETERRMNEQQSTSLCRGTSV